MLHEFETAIFLFTYLQLSCLLPRRRRGVGGVPPGPGVQPGPGGHRGRGVPRGELPLRGAQRHAGGPGGPQADPGPLRAVRDALRPGHGLQPGLFRGVFVHGLPGPDVQPVLRHSGGPDLRQPEGRGPGGQLPETQRLAHGGLPGLRLPQQPAGRRGGACWDFSRPTSSPRPARQCAGPPPWRWWKPQVTEAQRQRTEHPFAQLGPRFRAHLQESWGFFRRNPRTAYKILAVRGGGPRPSTSRSCTCSSTCWTAACRSSFGGGADGLPAGGHGGHGTLHQGEGAALPPGGGLRAVLRGGHLPGRGRPGGPCPCWGGALAELVFSVLDLRVDAALNDDFPSDQRATLVSVNSMAYSLLMIAASPVAGAVGDVFGASYVFVILRAGGWRFAPRPGPCGTAGGGTGFNRCKGDGGKIFPAVFLFAAGSCTMGQKHTRRGPPVDGQKDLRISDLLRMQEELQEKYKGIWEPVGAWPRPGCSFCGWWRSWAEVVSIVKKRKVEGIMEDPAVRARFLEEMSDVLMYYTDTLLCLGVDAGGVLCRLRGKAPAEHAAGFCGGAPAVSPGGKGVSYGKQAKNTVHQGAAQSPAPGGVHRGTGARRRSTPSSPPLTSCCGCWYWR